MVGEPTFRDRILSVVWTREGRPTPESWILGHHAYVIKFSVTYPEDDTDVARIKLEWESNRFTEEQLREFIRNSTPGYHAVRAWIDVVPYSGPLSSLPQSP